MNQPIQAKIDALHGAVMNIPCRKTMSQFATVEDRKNYAEGHRDARHDAAELVCKFSAELESGQAAPETYLLRVWWIPQVGMGAEPFHVSVADVAEAKKLLTTLAEYDLYQFRFNIKPDYTNVGGLEVKDGDADWVEWETADGDDVHSLMLDDLAQEVEQ